MHEVVRCVAGSEVDGGVPVGVHVGGTDRVHSAVRGPEEGSGSELLELEEEQAVRARHPLDVTGPVGLPRGGGLCVLVLVLHGSYLIPSPRALHGSLNFQRASTRSIRSASPRSNHSPERIARRASLLLSARTTV